MKAFCAFYCKTSFVPEAFIYMPGLFEGQKRASATDLAKFCEQKVCSGYGVAAACSFPQIPFTLRSLASQLVGENASSPVTVLAAPMFLACSPDAVMRT